MLYRGQTDCDWPLRTTLERTTDFSYTVEQYLERASSCVNEIESVTCRKWGLSPYPQIIEEIRSAQDFMRVHLPHYEYLVYLRQHGFPSPLLDWTTSPYIAAYFALEERNCGERCAVFVFIETPQGIKSGRGGDALIRTMGPYVTTHIRHFAQKAWYTTATRWDRKAKTHTFCSHHELPPVSSIVTQDVLVKVTIPRRDRVNALRQLEDYNINHYTLFQSEDSLIRAMGLRAFDLRRT